jgi:hypothetical protein
MRTPVHSSRLVVSLDCFVLVLGLSFFVLSLFDKLMQRTAKDKHTHHKNDQVVLLMQE